MAGYIFRSFLCFLMVLGITNGQKDDSIKANPISTYYGFEDSFYNGLYEDRNVTFDKLILYNGPVAIWNHFELSGENSQYFEATNVGNVVQVSISWIFPESIINSTDFFLFELIAYDNFTVTGRTAIHIAIPKTPNCMIDSISESNWNSGLQINITDTDSGEIFRRGTTNVLTVERVTFLDLELNNPPYVSANIETDGSLVLRLLESFRNYESFETSPRMTVLVTLRCSRETRTLTVVTNIRDTNNHAPVFSPLSSYNFSVFLPIMAGFSISQIYGDIIVRDLDISNIDIIPTIETNENFRLVYKEVDCTGKNYKLSLEATRTITSLDSPISLFIMAQDNDTTGYPPLSSFGRVTVEKNSETTMDLMFEKPYYQSVYDFGLRFEETIRLLNYRTNVTYSLEGSWTQYFSIIDHGNGTVLITSSYIPDDVIQNTDSMIFSLKAISSSSANVESIALTAIHVSFFREQNCQIEGISNWATEYNVNILDTDRNTVLTRNTENIVDIISIDDAPFELNSPPYVRIDFIFNETVSWLDVGLLPRFASYERNEQSLKITTIITFKCTRNIRNLTLVINIRDTNNHSPVFYPTSYYNFDILAPVGTNFPVSTVYGEIIVEDIDLTNIGIIALIDPNDFFRIDYKGVDQTGKNHTLVLSTMRNITSNLFFDFLISATDYDQTGDMPRRTFANVSISTNLMSTLNEGMLFENTVYNGIYKDERIHLEDPIRLKSGFNDAITFFFEGDDSKYFTLNKKGIDISLDLKASLLTKKILAEKNSFDFKILATDSIVTETVTVQITIE